GMALAARRRGVSARSGSDIAAGQRQWRCAAPVSAGGSMSRRDQRGVAVVTALLMTALAVSIVAGLFWHQQVQITLVDHHRVRMQEEWLLRDMLDWAQVLLIEDDRRSIIDYEGEAWSRPLGAPVTSRLAQAVVRGMVSDAQGRFNLNNLSDEGQVDPVETATF